MKPVFCFIFQYDRYNANQPMQPYTTELLDGLHGKLFKQLAKALKIS